MLGLLAAAILAAAALVAATVGRSPQRNDLATYWGFVAGVVAIAAPLIIWALRQAKKREDRTPTSRELDQLADQLAHAVKEQWEEAAGERGLLEPDPIQVRWRQPLIALGGPLSAAVESRRFSPLPGMSPTTSYRLKGGDIGELHRLYGGLGSGRLVITGAAGAGKTGTAVLLILASLKYREEVSATDQAAVPVPVMFTLHEWDPADQPVREWLVKRLGQTYPILSGREREVKATQLIATGKIAVILDGLDEMPEKTRFTALQALSQQASFRLVILTRRDEMAAATAKVHLQGAATIELCDVDPEIAADYLTRVQLNPPPPAWTHLTERLRHEPDSPLAHALSNPLMLTLVRDTFPEGNDVDELLDFFDSKRRSTSRDDIVDYVLDRVLPIAYAKIPGRPTPPYNLPTAQRSLRHIATQMNIDGTRDLQWWHIPNWASRTSRVLATMPAVGLVIGLVVGVTLSAVQAIPIAVTFGLSLGFLAGSRGEYPERVNRIGWKTISKPRTLSYGLSNGLSLGIWNGVLFGVMVWLFDGIQAGVVIGLVACTVTIMAFILITPSADDGSSATPLSSWHGDWTVVFLLSVIFGLLSGSVFAVLSSSPVLGLDLGLIGGIAFGLCASEVWPTSITFIQLRVRWHSPIRMIRFLEDARERNILRTIGPVYQFRHARLQDRLAEQPMSKSG